MCRAPATLEKCPDTGAQTEKRKASIVPWAGRSALSLFPDLLLSVFFFLPVPRNAGPDLNSALSGEQYNRPTCRVIRKDSFIRSEARGRRYTSAYIPLPKKNVKPSNLLSLVYQIRAPYTPQIEKRAETARRVQTYGRPKETTNALLGDGQSSFFLDHYASRSSSFECSRYISLAFMYLYILLLFECFLFG